MACRTSLFSTRTLLPILCLAALLALALRPAAAQSFDAAHLSEPVQIGAVGLVQAGDDPAWAQPDFDDSGWLKVDKKTLLSEYFPNHRSDIVWRRIHINVSPQQTELAIKAYSISRAFELYVNGQKLIESGQVEPFVPYTRAARLTVRIPEAQIRTGSLLIAIRARAPRTWWKSISAGFNGPMLTLGDETTLRSQSALYVIGESTMTVLESLLGLAVGLVALALFLGQRRRVEYFWVFMLGVFSFATLPLAYLSVKRNVPASWWTLNELLNFAGSMTIMLIYQAFLRKRYSRLLWVFITVAFLVSPAADLASLYGILPGVYDVAAAFPIGIIVAVILPLLLIRELRRGNREAGILLIPVFLYSLSVYASYSITLLELIPPFRAAALHAAELVFSFRLGILTVGLADLGTLSFYFSLTIIMVLRSTRMSRQQAVFEGELEAARQVQQVILPEQVESVPGFTVESVYQPAQQVGGDFFQILPDNRGGLLIVVGDVAGKGLPAAMLVSVLVGAIRTVANYSQSPSEVLAQLNERLVGRSHGSFSTALAAHISADGWVTIANAGHLSPYLDGREVELPGALPLGVVSATAYESTGFLLAPGSRLTFYSDGVVEAQNQKGELFGFDRAKALSTKPAAEIVDAAKQFGQSDDITVVAIQRAAAIATAA